MKRIILKLKQNKGETLTEVLVALLVASIATAMFAAMLGSSKRVVETSSKALEEYYAANNQLVAQASPVAEGQNVSLQLVSITNNGATVAKAGTVQLQPGAGNVKVDYFKNPKSTKVPVASFRIATGGATE